MAQQVILKWFSTEEDGDVDGEVSKSKEETDSDAIPVVNDLGLQVNCILQKFIIIKIKLIFFKNLPK